MKLQVGDLIVITEQYERNGYVTEIYKDLIMINWFDEIGSSFVYTEDEFDSWFAEDNAKLISVVK